MSHKNWGRVIGLVLIAVLGFVAFKSAKDEISTRFTMAELTTAINSHQAGKDLAISNLRLESQEARIRVLFAFAGTHAGIPVEGEAVVFGTPGYGAVRKHFTFSTSEVQITKLVSKGVGVSTQPTASRRDAPRDITFELGRAVEDAFASLKAHQLHPDDVTQLAWLNSAKVTGQEVTVRWDAVRTTTTTAIVLAVIVVLVLLTIAVPEFWFWVFFSWAMY